MQQLLVDGEEKKIKNLIDTKNEVTACSYLNQTALSDTNWLVLVIIF